MSTTAEEGIVAKLLATATVTALVSSRIQPPPLDDDSTLPIITWQVISAVRPAVMDGPLGYVRKRIQLTCWATTYTGASSLAEAVRIALDGASGSIAVGDDATFFHALILEDEGDILEPSAGLEQQRRVGKRLDFMAHAREANS